MSMLSYVVASDCPAFGPDAGLGATALVPRSGCSRPPAWATAGSGSPPWSCLAAGGSECQRALAAAAVAAVLANIVLVLVKGRVRRPRPCDVTGHRSPQPTAPLPAVRPLLVPLGTLAERVRPRLGARPLLPVARGAAPLRGGERRRFAGRARPALPERRAGGLRPGRPDRRGRLPRLSHLSRRLDNGG